MNNGIRKSNMSGRVLRQLSSITPIAILLSACGGEGADQAPAVIDAETVIADVAVVDVETGQLRAGRNIFLAGGEIAAIEPSASSLAPGDAEIIDGTGRYLIPGLADMHGHISTPDALPLYLAAGVTTVRDMWGEAPTLKLRDDIAAGRILGPQMVVAGRVIDGAPPVNAVMEALSDPEDADAIVKAQVEAGYDFVKIYSNMSLEVFDAVMEAAQKYDIEVSGHVPTDVPIEHAIKSGMKTSEHALAIIGAFLQSDEAPGLDLYVLYSDVRKFLSRIGRGETSLGDHIDEGRIEGLARLSAEHEHWYVPTLFAIRNFSSNPSSPATIDPKWHRSVPLSIRAQWEASWRQRAALYPMGLRRAEDQVQEVRIKALRAIHEAGGRILVGTDAPVPGIYWGGAVIEEIRAFGDAGFSNREVLYAATREAANYLGKAGKAGEVIVGAEADLVLLEANPLEDLAALHEVAGIVRGGQWLSRAELDNMLDDLARRYDQEEALLSSDPLFAEGSGRPADFISESKGAVRVALKADDNARSISFAVKESEADEWFAGQIEFGEGETIYWSQAGGPIAAIRRKGEGLTIHWEGAREQQVDDTDAAIILTNTPVDILTVEQLNIALGRGQEARSVMVWRCGARLDCDGVVPMCMSLVDLGAGRLDSGVLSRQIQLQACSEQDSARFSYWVSAGGSSWRASVSSGNPLQMDSGKGVTNWRRIR